jgi:hypothetical protein
VPTIFRTVFPQFFNFRLRFYFLLCFFLFPPSLLDWRNATRHSICNATFGVDGWKKLLYWRTLNTYGMSQLLHPSWTTSRWNAYGTTPQLLSSHEEEEESCRRAAWQAQADNGVVNGWQHAGDNEDGHTMRSWPEPRRRRTTNSIYVSWPEPRRRPLLPTLHHCCSLSHPVHHSPSRRAETIERERERDCR